MLSVLFALCAQMVQAEPAPALRVYFIGNSVTDAIDYGGLQRMAEAKGVRWTWGRHMIPGAPLSWLWDHQTGFTEEPFGASQKALTEHAWDAVVVQPFDRLLEGPDGDQAVIQRYFDLAKAKNPEVKLFVYARWPRMTYQGRPFEFDPSDFDPDKARSQIDLTKVDGFAERWNRPYTGGWDLSNETKDYFDTLVRALRRANPAVADQIRLVPVGHVFLELDTRMRRGQVPGFRSIFEVYSDSIHMGRVGSYLVAGTFFGALTGRSPVGLPHDTHGPVPPELARLAQQVTWQVLRREPLARVR